MSAIAVQVAVAVIVRNADEVLLAKRPSDTQQGDLWEFPGGKVNAGEDIRTALVRELYEELGMTVDKARPFVKVHYDYPDKSVVLNVWLINDWHGTPYGKEGQKICWVNILDLDKYKFLPANKMIIKAIQLPPLYLISPGPVRNPEEFLYNIEDCIKAGSRLLQLRCKEEMYHKQPEVISRLLDICNAYKALLLLNSTPAVAARFKAHGVHLNSARLLQLNHRPLDIHFWISASCHNQNELAHACRLGVDFAVLSPVNVTPSHPDAKPLGWRKFSELAGTSNIPIYALGGMHPEHLQQAWNNGAQGLAMLSGVWSASRPADIVRQCFR